MAFDASEDLLIIVRYWKLLIFSQDNADALDLSTMRRWNLILRLFFAEYLKLQPDDLEETSVSREPSELVSDLHVVDSLQVR